jgi:hypothetical protein
MNSVLQMKTSLFFMSQATLSHVLGRPFEDGNVFQFNVRAVQSPVPNLKPSQAVISRIQDQK